MEQSAFEAVMTGVNVFVFIVALSAAILLMSNVIDMVNFANERAITGMNGTIAENVGVVNDRIYTGAQMLTYYKNQMQRLESERQPLDYEFNVRLTELGDEYPLASYVQTESLENYINEEFILEYKGEIQGKKVYIFALRQESEV